MPCLGIYRQEFEKKFLTAKVITLEFAKMVSFMQKKKNVKFGTKIALFGYFWATILKNYFYIWNQHPRICQTLRFRVKIKMLKFGTKNTQFWCFETGIFKHYCRIWNEHPEIQWTFGIRSTFSKGPWSAFSERPGPRLGPLFKVRYVSLMFGVLKAEVDEKQNAHNFISFVITVA